MAAGGLSHIVLSALLFPSCVVQAVLFFCHHLCSGSLLHSSESWKMTLSLNSHSCQSCFIAFLLCVPFPHPTSHRLLSISHLSLELCLICHVLYGTIPDLCSFVTQLSNQGNLYLGCRLSGPLPHLIPCHSFTPVCASV